MTRYALTFLTMMCLAGWAVAKPPPAAPATQPAVGELCPILSLRARREAARALIDRFVAHTSASGTVDATAKRAVADAWKKHRNDAEPEGFLIAGVAIICEPFKVAFAALDEEDYASTDKSLRSLVDGKDPYVSLHAAALLARSLVEQDQLEAAEEVLTPLAGKEKELTDKSFLETEVDFLLGYCQLSNLHYDKALATLEAFERQHPGAPDRFRLPARQMLQELLVRQPERLGAVSDLMAYAGRRLGHGCPARPVQLKQERAVELLGKLIKEAEEQEKQSRGCKHCGGKGCRKCQGGRSGIPRGNWVPGSPADRSVLPGGPGRIGDLHRPPTARPGEVWGQMRPEERQRILQSLRKNFPTRYRQLIEQYYKQLAKER